MTRHHVPPAMWNKALSDAEDSASSLGNPLLSAVAFGSDIRNTGGASFNLQTREFLDDKDPVYMVGGEEGVAQAKIAPIAGSSEPPLNAIINQMHRIKTSVGSSGEVYLGAWNDAKGNVVFDASRKYGDMDEAMDVAKSRREDAIYDVKNKRDIPVDYSGDN